MPWYTYVELVLLSSHVTVMNIGKTVDPQRSSLITKQNGFVIGESFVVEPSYYPLFITAAWTLSTYIRSLPSGWHVLHFSFNKHCWGVLCTADVRKCSSICVHHNCWSCKNIIAICVGICIHVTKSAVNNKSYVSHYAGCIMAILMWKIIV